MPAWQLPRWRQSGLRCIWNCNGWMRTENQLLVTSYEYSRPLQVSEAECCMEKRTWHQWQCESEFEITETIWILSTNTVFLGHFQSSQDIRDSSRGVRDDFEVDHLRIRSQRLLDCQCKVVFLLHIYECHFHSESFQSLIDERRSSAVDGIHRNQMGTRIQELQKDCIDGTESRIIRQWSGASFDFVHHYFHVLCCWISASTVHEIGALKWTSVVLLGPAYMIRFMVQIHGLKAISARMEDRNDDWVHVSQRLRVRNRDLRVQMQCLKLVPETFFRFVHSNRILEIVTETNKRTLSGTMVSSGYSLSEQF